MPDSMNPPIKLDYIVVGTARGGTTYMARLLSSLGVMCGHESIFGYLGLEFAQQIIDAGETITSHVSRHELRLDQPHAEWFDHRRMRAESSWMAVPFLDQPVLAGAAIIHVVRHPLAVLSSLVTDNHFFQDAPNPFQPYVDFIGEHQPAIVAAPTELERACLYLIGWHELILRRTAARPCLRFKVEEMLNNELLDFLGVNPAARAQAHADAQTNSWKRRQDDLQLADLPPGETRDRLAALTARLGYRIER